MLRTTLRKLVAASGLSVALLLAGCVVPFGDVYRAAPDPQADQFVTVTAVSGRTVTLADGRHIELAGVDISSLTPERRQQFESQLQRMLMERRRILVQDESSGRARILLAVDKLPNRGSMVLFPRIVYVKPQRADVACCLIGAGYVRANTTEIGDPCLRAQYMDAEEYARSHAMEIWKTGDVSPVIGETGEASP